MADSGHSPQAQTAPSADLERAIAALPPKQLAVYRYIQRHTATHRLPPSLQQISDALELTGSSHASYYVQRLQAKGLIEPPAGKRRAPYHLLLTEIR